MRRFLLIGGLLFVALLIWRLPLAWVSAWLPAGVQCQGGSGSVWRGHCDTLRTPVASLQSLSWQLSLLRGEASLALQVDDTELQASTDLHWHFNGQWRAEALRARLPLEHPLLRLASKNYRGDVAADFTEVSGNGRQIQSAAGTVQLLHLHSSTDLGSYAVKLADGARPGEIAGDLRDLDGPLQVDGTLRIHATGYELHGYAVPRSGASTELSKALDLLGPPDEQGRRRLSLEGTF
jgi:hypothetical protein